MLSAELAPERWGGIGYPRITHGPFLDLPWIAHGLSVASNVNQWSSNGRTSDVLLSLINHYWPLNGP